MSNQFLFFIYIIENYTVKLCGLSSIRGQLTPVDLYFCVAVVSHSLAFYPPSPFISPLYQRTVL